MGNVKCRGDIVRTAVMGLSLCLLFSVFGLQNLAAQHYIGVKGGYGMARGRFYPFYSYDRSASMWNRYNGGLVWKYYSAQQVVGGVSVELEYVMRGFRFEKGEMSGTSDYNYKVRTVNSLVLPLIWQPHLYLANRHIRVFINAGFTLIYNTGIGDTETVFRQRIGSDGVPVPSKPVVTPYKMQIARDSRWNYGICFGPGIGVLFGRWEVFVEGRYYYGMSDIIRTKTRYIFNEEGSIRSELDNLFINFGVFFRLGKGGITEPPLRKRKTPPPSDSDFRNIKLKGMRY